MPKSYGSPTGTEKPKNQDRTEPKAGSAKNYLEHMTAAHKAFQSQQSPKAPPAQPPKGRGGTQMGRDVLGIGRATGKRSDKAVDDAG
jgi:hypothetical protein